MLFDLQWHKESSYFQYALYWSLQPTSSGNFTSFFYVRKADDKSILYSFSFKIKILIAFGYKKYMAKVIITVMTENKLKTMLDYVPCSI